jgi:hypothetical protein
MTVDFPGDCCPFGVVVDGLIERLNAVQFSGRSRVTFSRLLRFLGFTHDHRQGTGTLVRLIPKQAIVAGIQRIFFPHIFVV